MKEAFKILSKFALVFLVMTIINTVVWEHVAGDLYDCTDATLPGYLEPGHWVDAFDGHPVAVVSRIVHGRSMSEADAIKAGWSEGRLLRLWFVFFAFHILLSILLACMRWFPGQPNKSMKTNRRYQDPLNSSENMRCSRYALRLAPAAVAYFHRQAKQPLHECK